MNRAGQPFYLLIDFNSFMPSFSLFSLRLVNAIHFEAWTFLVYLLGFNDNLRFQLLFLVVFIVSVRLFVFITLPFRCFIIEADNLSLTMLFLCLFLLVLAREAMANVNCNPNSASDTLTLDGIRDSLIRQEDSIVFSLIERARFPLNGKMYLHNHASIPGFSGSLVEFIVRETEAVQAKVSLCLFV